MATTAQRWVVRLGEIHWRRFTHAREPGDGLELLGSVEKGAQIGALGLASDGRYYQVNGDYLTPLSNSQVRSAVRRAQVSVAAEERRAQYTATKTAPVVIVKKRRVITTPSTGERTTQLARESA